MRSRQPRPGAARVERTDGPTALALSRQALPHQPRTTEQIDAIRRGGYVLIEPAAPPAAIIIATGSEVALARAAAAQLAGRGRAGRASSPCPASSCSSARMRAWRDTVLPPQLPRVAVEAGATRRLGRYVGRSGAVIGIDRFGESAPAPELFEHFGFTPTRRRRRPRGDRAPRPSAVC